MWFEMQDARYEMNLLPNFACYSTRMKKTHIIILVLIVGAIAVLISMLPTLSTYETVASAKEKEGKFVHLIAKLDKSQPVQYDAVNNPNYLSFTAIDSLGQSVKVVYNNAKPENLEHSERLVLKGKMEADQFQCQEILMKCPSKYTDDPTRVQESVNQKLQTN